MEERKRKKRKRGTLLKLISLLKNVRKAGAKRGTISVEGNPCHPGSFSSPPPFLTRCSPFPFLAPTRSFVSSFNELSTNRDCRAFKRDGGTIRGLIYQRCRQCIRYFFRTRLLIKFSQLIRLCICLCSLL